MAFHPILRSRDAFVSVDQSIVQFMNRSMSLRGVQPFFEWISFLGDGIGWYGLMVALPVVAGTRGLLATVHMLLVGGLTLPIYKLIKRFTRRPRPCNKLDSVSSGGRQLDEYSFPSGHVMHAVAFSVVVAHWFPIATTVLVVVITLVALSRVVLGLHYLTDVVLGALLGFWIAVSTLSLFAHLVVIPGSR